MGGANPRKINFYVENGQVKLKRLESLHSEPIADRESQYFDKIQQYNEEGDTDIEIFSE